MLYSSLDNNKIKELKKLRDKKYRDMSSKFIIEGEHLVCEAYKCGLLKEVYILEGTKCDLDVEVNYVTPKVLKHISLLESPTIIGVADKIKPRDLGSRIVALDNIQDPGNLGTIIRSAVAFNVDTIILSNDTVDLYNDKVIRASEGMMFNINIIRTDLKEFLNNLDGYYIYGTKVSGGHSINSIEKKKKFVIIMGNEGKGMSSILDNICDDFIYIDMNSKCESLNVGVATSIILYELSR